MVENVNQNILLTIKLLYPNLNEHLFLPCPCRRLAKAGFPFSILQTFVLFFACLLHSGTARCDRRRIDFFPQIHYL
jgi:hypothetical protein